MKHYRYFILFLVMFLQIGTLKLLAQEQDSRVWSIVKLDPDIKQGIKQDIYWQPAEQVPRFFDLLNGITVGPNFRPKATTNSTQSETSVDIHPSNSDIIFCSANATNYPVTGVYGTGVYWTTNGGISWIGYDDPPFGSNSGDPVSIIGADGRFYENYISDPGGQGVSVSTNNGVTWNTYTVAPNPGSLADKNHYMVDKQTGSAYLHRSYCAWTDFGGTNSYDVVTRYSSNYGQNWSSSVNLSSSLSSYLNQGVNIQTGPNGEVYAVWAVYIDGSVSTGEDGIGFAKSTNGGVTWSTPTYAYSASNFGIRGNLASKNGIRVSSFPSMAVDRSGGPNNGTIYITWPQRGVSPAGSDPDIVFIKSTNSGTSWTAPVRVNDDPLNNGKDQYYPWCTVDQSTGQFMIVFYDSRDVVNSQAEVFMARSYDGGNTFENFKVSDQPHTPSPISGLASGYAGDYIGVAAYNDLAYPYWGDNRTGIYQGWMAKVTFGPPCPVLAPSNPNPANGASNVSANLAQLSWTNGSGSTQCEVWYGEAGSMVQVYNGSLISSWTIPDALEYSTQYNWQIINKNDTCSTSGPAWSFTTELSPDVVFQETFEDLNCWTAAGPLGTTNWSIQNTSNAGGVSPELELHWSPQFSGLSKLVSCVIQVENNHDYTVYFDHFLDWYTNPAPTLGLGVSYDNGTTYTTIWSLTATGNVGPESINASFTTPINDSPDNTNLYLVLYCNGNSYNIDDWYIDNILVVDDEYSIVTDPTAVNATAMSDSQIDVSFTPNLANDNVVIVWNNSGTFTEPSGIPPAIGQPFAGGSLLYNGIFSPVNHTGLAGSTTYHYKLFSYDGSNYSPGVTANALTFPSTDFVVDLLINDNCNNSISLIFGTAPGATECYDDGFDQWAPPPPPGGAFDGRFVACNEGLFIDIKGTNLDEERIWNIQHQPAEGCSPVTLSWDPAELPSGGYFHLVDAFLGTLVNINMRLNSSYTDLQDLRNFQIKYNYEYCSDYNINDGWNLLSLPLGVTNANYLSLFPNANTGTLYGFSSGYFTTETIATCTGYWLKFPGSEFVGVCGTDITECVIDLNAGWNMIGGPNCNVSLDDVEDPGGIIIPGTIYGYNSGYFTASSIDATKAYWVKTTSAGTITVSCASFPDNQRIELAINPEVLESFSTIEITDASNNKQTLYFGSELDKNIDIESFSLPPLPPPGAFDVRFEGDYRVAESDEVIIRIQSSDFPLNVKLNNLDQNGVTGYVLKEIADGVETNSSKVEGTTEIIITNSEVTLIKLSKEESLPVTYNLDQNYPNPFNPVTTIKFSLPEAANVSLIIYNALGQKVEELVNSNLEAGRYNYQWAAEDAASGMYIYELRTEKFVSMKKMILLK